MPTYAGLAVKSTRFVVEGKDKEEALSNAGDLFDEDYDEMKLDMTISDFEAGREIAHGAKDLRG